MIPIVPALAGLATFAGGATLLWYDTLSRDDRHRVNRLTGEYAVEMFGKTVERLTGAEAQAVRARIKAGLMNKAHTLN